MSQKKVDKNDMEETIEESRELRRKLIDTQTNLAIVRSEMEKLRAEYELKCEQFNNKYVIVLKYIKSLSLCSLLLKMVFIEYITHLLGYRLIPILMKIRVEHNTL